MKGATGEENSRYIKLGDYESGCKRIIQDTLYGETMKGTVREENSRCVLLGDYEGRYSRREFTLLYIGRQ